MHLYEDTNLKRNLQVLALFLEPVGLQHQVLPGVLGKAQLLLQLTLFACKLLGTKAEFVLLRL